MTVTTATNPTKTSECWAGAHIHRNPFVLEQELPYGFRYLKNPLLPFGERLLNPLQSLVFARIGVSQSIEELQSATGLSMPDLSTILGALAAQQFVAPSPHFGLSEAKLSKRSLSLWIQTSDRCNLACHYCYVSASPRGGLINLDALDQLHNHLLRLAGEGDLQRVQLKLAGGEPLLTFGRWSSAIVRLKNNLESKGVAVRLQILTNGTVLSPAILAYIAEHRVGVGLSIDGLGATHDLTRHFHSGRGSFEILERNLGQLKSAGIDPYVSAVIAPGNVDHLESLTSYLIRENLRFRFSLAKGAGIDLERTIEALKSSYRLVEENLSRFHRFLSHTLCDLSFNRPVSDSPCGVGRSHGSIGINGEIHACQTLIRSSPLALLSETEDLFDVIQRVDVRSKLLPISASCEECVYRHVCGGGCPAVKVSNKSPFCIVFHQVLPTILRLRGLTLLNRLCCSPNQVPIAAATA